MANKMNPVILAPIRMGDLSGVQLTDKTPLKTAYVPPNRRQGKVEKEIITSLDFNSAAFPCMANSVPQEKSLTFGGFKQKVLDLLEKEKLDEIERNRLVETDYTKMTNEQLINDGWAILPLKPVYNLSNDLC